MFQRHLFGELVVVRLGRNLCYARCITVELVNLRCVRSCYY